MHWAIASSFVEPAATPCPPILNSPGLPGQKLGLQAGNQLTLSQEQLQTTTQSTLADGGDVASPSLHPVQRAEDQPTHLSVQEPVLQDEGKDDTASEVAALQQQLQLFKAQLADAIAQKEAAQAELKKEQAAVASFVIPKYPAHGQISAQDWDKMHLRLKKAERALEQERTRVEMMRQQLDDQRDSAAVGAHASTTIQCLERELAACRALAVQRTCEAEALQRALILSDETVARLRAQLPGLLESNQVAMAREQDMERQVLELKRLLAQQAAQAAQSLAAAQQHGQGGYEALQAQVAKLQQENKQLTEQAAERASALTAARAECARKDAGIRALESVLSQHGRRPASNSPQAAHSAAVAIDMRAVGEQAAATGGAATPCEPTLPGGLTDDQWKLVMLSEEVRSLRTTVQQLRRQAASPHAQLSVLPPVRIGVRNGSSEDGREVLEVDLPPEEVTARVELLAKQMLQLEEELQTLLQGSNNTTNGAQQMAGGPAENGMHQADQLQGLGAHAAVVAEEGLTQAARQQALQDTGTSAGAQSVGGQQALRKKAKRRGWWGWLVGAQDDVSLV